MPGNSAVTGRGTASVTHHVTMSTSSASVTFMLKARRAASAAAIWASASRQKASGVGQRRTRRNSNGPAKKPIPERARSSAASRSEIPPSALTRAIVGRRRDLCQNTRRASTPLESRFALLDIGL